MSIKKLYPFGFILFALLCFGMQASLAHAAVTLVQSEPGNGNFTGCTTGQSFCTNTFASSTLTGDSIVAVIYWLPSTGTTSITSVGDTASNTFHLVSSTFAIIPGTDYSNLYSEIAYATGTIAQASDTVTVSFAGNNPTGALSLMEITPGVLDMASAATGTSANPNAGTVTTGSAGEFAVAGGVIDDGFGISNWFGPGSGWTLFDNFGGGNLDIAAEYENQATAGAITGNIVSNFPSDTGPWVASMATFKSSGGGSNPPPTEYWFNGIIKLIGNFIFH